MFPSGAMDGCRNAPTTSFNAYLPWRKHNDEVRAVCKRETVPARSLTTNNRVVSTEPSLAQQLNTESPSDEELKDTVLRMRTAGLKPSSCNSHIRAINSYLHWNSNAGSKCSPTCPHPKISRLKEPNRALPTFSAQDIQRFLSWKPKTFTQRRLQCLLLTLADTGARIGEALALRWSDVDWDSLLLTLHGKPSTTVISTNPRAGTVCA